MGCGTSTVEFNSRKAYARAALNAENADPETPEITSSRTRQLLKLELDSALSRMQNSIFIFNNDYTNDEAKVHYKGTARLILLSEYFKLMSDISCPCRISKQEWLKFEYPDNGHWKVGIDHASGVTFLVAATPILGVRFSFSMVCLNTDINSKDYAEQGQLCLKDQLAASDGKLEEGAKSKIKEISALSITRTGNIECYEWEQVVSLTICRGGNSMQVNAKSLEIRGTRRVSDSSVGSIAGACSAFPSAPRTLNYGINITVSAQSPEHFETMIPLFRKILGSVEISSVSRCEEQMGEFWDRICVGRR